MVASPGPELDLVAQQEQVRALGIPMQREISLAQDLVTLWRLYHLLRRERPGIVNASTPKAGLLGMLAAWLGASTHSYLPGTRPSPGNRIGPEATDSELDRADRRRVCEPSRLQQPEPSAGVSNIWPCSGWETFDGWPGFQ